MHLFNLIPLPEPDLEHTVGFTPTTKLFSDLREKWDGYHKQIRQLGALTPLKGL